MSESLAMVVRPKLGGTRPVPVLEHIDKCSVEQWKCPRGGSQLRYDLGDRLVVKTCCESCKRRESDTDDMFMVRKVTLDIDFQSHRIKNVESHELSIDEGWYYSRESDSPLPTTRFQRLMGMPRDAKERASKYMFEQIKWTVKWEDQSFETAAQASAGL